MSAIYDNWERLVAAAIKKQQLWELFHSDSRATSISSLSSSSSDFSFYSHIPDFPYPSSTSWYRQNPIPEDGVYRWGYSAHDPEVKGFNKTEKKKSIALIPEEILVNGKPLSRKELLLLQRCSIPPKDLVPGDYWYDKHSGFWGKLGQKPSQIISSNLDVGGRVQEDASNGKTRVYVNGREITRVELRLFKFAGVGCHRDDHLWMYDDGRYEEEANCMRGSIWSKLGVKLFCSLLSLPYLPKSAHNTSGEVSVSLNLEHGAAIQKLLLVGCRGSGTSTLFKQALFLYKEIPFLKGELEHIRLFIQSNLYRYVCLLLEGRKLFEEENMSESEVNEDNLPADNSGDVESTYSLNPRLTAISEWLVNVMASKASEAFDASFIQTSSPLVLELMNSPALQQTFIRRNELEYITASANYFLERAVDIFRRDYKPHQGDILYSEDFFPPSPSYTIFPLHSNSDDYMAHYQLIRSTSLSSDGDEDDNSLGIYEDVRVVIFCVPLTDYDQFVLDEHGELVNKMVSAREYLKSVIARPFLERSEVLLLLTNYDLFWIKIQHIPLNQCEWFDDFPVNGNGQHQSNAIGEIGFHYISAKFKRFYADLTSRKMYAARVNCLGALSADAALRYAAEISKWGEEKGEYEYWSEFDSTTDDDEMDFTE